MFCAKCHQQCQLDLGKQLNISLACPNCHQPLNRGEVEEQVFLKVQDVFQRRSADVYYSLTDLKHMCLIYGFESVENQIDVLQHILTAK